MRNLKRLTIIIGSILIMCGAFYVLNAYQKTNARVYIQFDVKSKIADEYQLFFSSKNEGWSEVDSETKDYNVPGSWQTIRFELPRVYSYLRLDMGKINTSDISLRDMYFGAINDSKVKLTELDMGLNEIDITESNDNLLIMNTTGTDPFLYFFILPYITASYEGYNLLNVLLNIIVSALAGLSFYFIMKRIRHTFGFVRELIGSRDLVLNLAKNDFKTRFASSYLGVLWGFIQPLITIVTYWFVFQVGLRSGDVGDVPFIIWFIAGIVPWFFFSEALTGATNVFSEYSYLVKKVVFKIELLPFVKILSAGFVQIFFILFIFIVYGFYGFPPNLYNIQIIYYFLCMLVLVTGITFLTSAVVLFFKDLNQIIAVIVQIGFWFTPIGW